MGSRFYLDSASENSLPSGSPDPPRPASSGSSSSSEFDFTSSTLPFPAPLSRASFTPTSASDQFDPHAYLTTLTTSSAGPRFQSLPDLRAELLQLSQSLNKELVDLVNANYEVFLALGDSLKGGRERVEEVRIGVLGFERDVGKLGENVGARRKEVEKCMEDLRRVRREKRVGWGLLEVERRLDEMESTLGLVHKEGNEDRVRATVAADEMEEQDEVSDDEDGGSGSDETDDDEEAEDPAIPPRLRRGVEEFLVIRTMIANIGLEHPFLTKQQDRIAKIRQTVMSRLEAAMRQAQDDELRRQIVRLRISVDEEIISAKRDTRTAF